MYFFISSQTIILLYVLVFELDQIKRFQLLL